MRSLGTHIELVRRLEREQRGPELHPLVEMAFGAALVFGVHIAESWILRLVGR